MDPFGGDVRVVAGEGWGHNSGLMMELSSKYVCTNERRLRKKFVIMLDFDEIMKTSTSEIIFSGIVN